MSLRARRYAAGAPLAWCLVVCVALTTATVAVPLARAGVAPGVLIETAAGNGTMTTSGDSGLAVDAGIDAPTGVVGTTSEFYVASGNATVRRVTSAGVIERVAGNGTAGYSGDGGLATSAMLNCPRGIAHANGALYIADECSDRVRVVRGGVITTYAGTGSTTGPLNDGGPAGNASLSDPTDVAVGGNDVYIADCGHDRVRRIDAAGIISTFSNFAFDCPRGLGVDRFGFVWVADVARHIVVKLDSSGAPVLVVGQPGLAGYRGDGGTATEALLSVPLDVTIDAAGTAYIVDGGNHRIRAVSPAGTISTVAGNGQPGYSGDGGPALLAQISQSSQIAVDTLGGLLLADTFNYRVRRIGMPVANPPNGVADGAGNASDGCGGGEALVARTAADSTVVLSTVQADADSRWVCVRADGPAVATGGRFEITSAGVSGGGVPATDDDADACAEASGNTVPGPHPVVEAAVGDPSEPGYAPVRLDVYGAAHAAWVCLVVGGERHRVLVPLGVAAGAPEVVFVPDAPGTHLHPSPPPTAPSGTCQAAADPTLWDVTAPGTRSFVYGSPSRLCVRVEGPIQAGGLVTVGTSSGDLPDVQTSTTDMTPCTVQVAEVGGPANVAVRRSPTGGAATSICVIAGANALRVTIGSGSGGSPVSVTWTPDPGTPGLP